MMASQAPNHPTSNLFADGTLLPTERTTAACRRRSGTRCRISTAAPGGVLIKRPFTSGALAQKLKALGLRSRLRSSRISSTVLSIRRTFKVSTTRTAQRSSASRRNRRGSFQQAAKSRNFTAQKSNFLTELVNNVFELGNSPVHQTRRKSGLCAGDCPACAGNVCVSAAVMRSNFPRKPENAKTRKRTGKRENRENRENARTRKRENGQENAKTAKTRPRKQKRENRENGTFIQ